MAGFIPAIVPAIVVIASEAKQSSLILPSQRIGLLRRKRSSQ
jgi:hypothetical protein